MSELDLDAIEARHAREDVPAMAREIRRLREENERLKELGAALRRLEDFVLSVDPTDWKGIAAKAHGIRERRMGRPLPAPPEVK